MGEPQNLSGLNSYKYSGLANKKAVGFTVVKSGDVKELLSLTKKQSRTHAQSQPKKLVLSKAVKKSNKKGLAQVNKELCAAGYRRDLVKAAGEKFMKLKQSLRKPRVQKLTKRLAGKKAKKPESEE